MAYAFEIYKDRKGEFRVRFKASNGEIMFSTEGYTAKVSARNAIKSFLKNAPAAMVHDLTEAAAAPKAGTRMQAPATKRATKKRAVRRAPKRR